MRTDIVRCSKEIQTLRIRESEVEHKGQRHQQHPHRSRKEMEEFIADLRMPNQEYQARRRNHEHKRIRLIEVNERIHQRLNHPLCLNTRSQGKMDLLRKDNQTNGRKNPMDDA